MEKYIKGITEARAIKLFTAKYGNNIWKRFNKLTEEFNELIEIKDKILNNGSTGIASNPEDWEHLDDEISDLYCVLTHLASVRGLTHKQLLDMGIDKIKQMETNPDYKRFR